MTLIPIPSDPTPADEAIRILEEALATARKGNVSAVAIAVVYRDGSTGDAWSKPASTATLIGAVSVLHTRLCYLLTKADK